MDDTTYSILQTNLKIISTQELVHQGAKNVRKSLG